MAALVLLLMLKKSSEKHLEQSSVLTIHNLEHQGIFSDKLFGKTGLPGEFGE